MFSKSSESSEKYQVFVRQESRVRELRARLTSSSTTGCVSCSWRRVQSFSCRVQASELFESVATQPLMPVLLSRHFLPTIPSFGAKSKKKPVKHRLAASARKRQAKAFVVPEGTASRDSPSIPLHSPPFCGQQVREGNINSISLAANFFSASCRARGRGVLTATLQKCFLVNIIKKNTL